MKLRQIKAILFLVPVLVACSANNSHYSFNNRLSVVLVDDARYQIVSSKQELNPSNNHIAYVDKGENVNFVVSVNYGYQLFATDQDNSTIVYIDDFKYSVTISNVNYSMRVKLLFDDIEKGDSSSPDDSSYVPSIKNQITYDANGGEYILFDGYQQNKVIYSTAHHPRPNTSIGTNIMKRDGYTLNGWNTMQDGSGQHIGLGSRYLDEENDCFTLYAEWEQHSASNLFAIKRFETGCLIDQYLGYESKVVIPDYISGFKILKIGENAFKDKNCQTVILPSTIKEIADNAFSGCAFKELYFYDCLVNVNDKAFSGCNNLSTIHINAIEAPRYSDSDRHSTYADKIDRLYLLRNTKKIVVMGGSGAFYNIDACRLHEIAPDYETVNVGINGWFNAQMQFEIIENYVGNEDIFIHSVESCGEYQFMKRNDMGDFDFNKEYDCRYFNCLELNYDLISLADVRHTTHFFDVYHVYNTTRLTKDPTTYNAYTNFADERGDYSSDPEIRIEYKGEPSSINREGKIDPSSHSEEGLLELGAYYDKLTEKGAKLYFVYSCINIDSLSADDLDSGNMYKYYSPIETTLHGKIEFVNKIDEVLYPSDWFADTDWHLDYEHALVFTNYVAEWIELI